MSFFWQCCLSLLIYFAGVGVGILIANRRAYRRGVRDGLEKKLYAAYKEYSEQHKE